MSVSEENVERVVEELTETWLRGRFGVSAGGPVSGVGAGEDKDGPSVHILLTRELSPGELPAEHDGVPLNYLVVGSNIHTATPA